MLLLTFLKPYILMTAVTDFQTRQHCYSQRFTLLPEHISIDKNKAVWRDSGVVKRENGMLLKSRRDDFSYKLKLDYGKGAFWHCDRGKLYMGREEKQHGLINRAELLILWIFIPIGNGFPCASMTEKKSCCFIFRSKIMGMVRI